MKKDATRLIVGFSLTLVVGLAAAQRGGHSSGGGGGRSSGGGGYSGGGHRSGGYSSSRTGSRGYPSFSGRTEASSSYSRSYTSSASVASALGSRYSRQTSPASAGSFERSHASESRSGAVAYQGNNNRNVGRATDFSGERFGSAPRGLVGGPGFDRVTGGDRGRFGYGGYRHGYFGYGLGWRDSFFCFPFYCFDPFIAPCYCSPWYYYPCLPPYVAAPNVIIESNTPNTEWSGRDYDWEPGTPLTTNPVLDASIQDLVQSFEKDDHQAIDRVTPHSGNVKIFVDGKYSYSLKANDFYDTYVDGIESTKTDRYQIIDIKTNADGTAKVVAKHLYNDPWGNRTAVFHNYFLVKEGDQYVIREFGTSDYRTGL